MDERAAFVGTDARIGDLGFPAWTDVSQRISIADLFFKKPTRCGIYVLGFADGERYVGQSVDVGRAAAVVDVAAVGLDRHRGHLGTEPPEDLRGDAVGRAVGAVEQDPLAGQVEALEAELQLAQVVPRGAVQLAHAG